jgi:hypothetical protein
MRASVFAWGWPAARTRWRRACAGFARDLLAERGDIDRVQCRFAKMTSPSAVEVRMDEEPGERWVMTLEVGRDEGRE